MPTCAAPGGRCRDFPEADEEQAKRAISPHHHRFQHGHGEVAIEHALWEDTPIRGSMVAARSSSPGRSRDAGGDAVGAIKAGTARHSVVFPDPFGPITDDSIREWTEDVFPGHGAGKTKSPHGQNG